MENRLSPLDAAFWSLESPDAPMHIGALAHFDGAADASPPDLDAVAAVLAERAQAIPRLRQRVRTPWNPLEGPYWEEQPDFDAAAHIVTHAPAEDDEDPDGAVAGLMAAPVPREAPPWEMNLLPGGGSGFSLLLKVHHAAVDGLRALDVGVRLLDQFAGREKPDATTRRPNGRERHAAPTGPLALRALRSIPVEAKRTLRAAEIASDTLLSVAGSAPRSLLQPAALLRPSALIRPSSEAPGLALPSYPLDDLHRIRKAHGGTVNDVVLAVLAGALRAFGDESGQGSRNARVLVPVSQRARLGAPGGGNRLSGYLLDLPVTEPDPRRRLERVRAAMDAHKQRGPRRGPGAVALLAELLPAPGHRLTAPLLRPTAPLLFDALVTNVPMPDFRFTLDGHTLTGLYPLPPLARGQALAVAVSSYRGRLHVGLRGRLDTTDLHRAFDVSLAELLATC
ncbi:wax ester/triacylglycerol synthase family O-acyltransferase [Streptacidiphilus sp. MAP5-3]|uniref:wax ester/triacylglycerol synthase family O-acyltransferase n=1 Tax=unclassified Streptacidiphilus TaxID=2643834 RepID=UPI0035194C3E